MIRRSPHARGYTFLEVTLALGLALILVAGIYSAVQMTYQQWEVGRQAADEAQVVRALFQRIRADLQATMTTWAPPQPLPAPSAPGTTTTPGATAGASSTTSPSTTSGSTTSGSASATAQNPTQFPPGGVLGANDSISVVARLAPADLDFSPTLPVGTTASVMKTITYRVGSLQDSSSIDDGVEGLIRDESPGMPDANSPDGHSQDGRSDLMAPEVKRIRVTYYDGLYWNDTWDLTQSGPPICAQIEVGLKLNSFKNVDADGLRWYQALIAFPPAVSSSADASASSGSSPASSSSGAGAGATGSGATGGTGS